MIIRHLFIKINNIPDSDSFLNEDTKKEEDKPKKELKDSDSKKVTVTKSVQNKKTGKEIARATNMSEFQKESGFNAKIFESKGSILPCADRL